MIATSGAFVYSVDGGSLYAHVDRPAPGYVTLSYEPAAGDLLVEGDALIVPLELFVGIAKLVEGT